MREVREAADAIREHADPEANVIFGASFSEALEEDVLITLIATGWHAFAVAPPVEAASTGDQPRVVESAPAVRPAPGVGAGSGRLDVAGLPSRSLAVESPFGCRVAVGRSRREPLAKRPARMPRGTRRAPS